MKEPTEVSKRYRYKHHLSDRKEVLFVPFSIAVGSFVGGIMDSLSVCRFAACAYFFECASRSNPDDRSRDRARACKTHGCP